MIKEIEFENYKAFKNGKLRIRPITILLGVNSAGKSSLIQLFLMLTQTFGSRKNSNNTLLLNGPLVQLGESKNIFHNRNLTSPIGIKLNVFEVDYQSLIEDVHETLVMLYYSLDRTYSMVSSEGTVQGRLRYDSLTDFVRNQNVKSVFSLLSGLKRKINIQAKKLSEEDFSKLIDVYLRYSNIQSKDTISLVEKKVVIDFAPYKHTLQCVKVLSDINTKQIRVNYTFKHNERLNSIEIAGFKILSDNIIIISYNYCKTRKGKRHTLISDIFDNKILAKYSSKFGKAIDLTNIELLSLRVRNRKVDNNYFIQFLLELLEQSLAPLERCFSSRNINYISPLRAYPRRYYFQNEIVTSKLNGNIDSFRLVELLKERGDIRKKLNNWMKRFSINIDIAEIEEVIHKIRIQQSGLSLDITDVGFGISQIMPIIAQSFLATTNSITLIEQPEIHLHPMMQSELADFFIDVYKDDKRSKNFIIETHSEYFLRRIRRRISEGKLDSNDVAIYFIEPRLRENGSAMINNIEISKNGSFDWPKDFYETELEDNLAFLSNISSK